MLRPKGCCAGECKRQAGQHGAVDCPLYTAPRGRQAQALLRAAGGAERPVAGWAHRTKAEQLSI